MASCFSSFSFKGDERRLLVAPEYNAEVVLILFAFRNRACHIVVQPHDDLAEADLASSMIVPVIEIAFDVVGTPFHKLFLKVGSPCLHFFIGKRPKGLYHQKLWAAVYSKRTVAYPFADKAKTNLVEVRRVNTASTISQRDAYKLMLKDYPDVMSMFGFQVPAADPRNYDADGKPVMPKDRGDAR